MPDHIIDTHTHIFNARYLPLEGIVYKWTKQRWLARAVDGLVNRLTASEEPRVVEHALSLWPEERREPPADSAPLEELAERHVANSISRLQEELRIVSFSTLNTGRASVRATTPSALATELLADDEVLPILVEIDDRRRQEEIDRKLQQSTVKELRDRLRDRNLKVSGRKPELVGRLRSRVWERGTDDLRTLLGNAVSRTTAPTARLAAGEPIGQLFDRVRQAVKWVVNKVIQAIRALDEVAAEYVRFFLRLVQSESRVVERLERQYDDQPRLQTYFHFMMDMECAYDDEPWYPYWEQLRRMHWQQVRSGGRLVGFAAFDPRRTNWKEYVDEAMQLGFVGFKFYPPMGFRPAKNDENGKPDLEQTLDEFFDFCENAKIPVMAHCTPTGFEAYTYSGLEGHPEFWEARLKKNENLHLCLLHAGGAEQKNGNPDNEEEFVHSPGWFASQDTWEDPDNFAKKVVELCTDYHHVYCEISYYHEAMAGSEQQYRDRLAANIRREVSACDKFAKRIMYGSDWHMPAIIDEADDYLEMFLQIFEHEDLRPHQDRFFWRNAVEFLDIDTYWDRLRSMSGVPPAALDYAEDLKDRLDGMEARR